MLLAVIVATACLSGLPLSAQDVTTSGAAATLVSADNVVEVGGAGGAWAAANAGQPLNIGDRLKTGEDSRASVRMADGSVLQLDELTTIEIKPPQGGSGKPTGRRCTRYARTRNGCWRNAVAICSWRLGRSCSGQ